MLAVTQFATQFTHVPRHVKVWNRKQNNFFKEKQFLKCGLRNSKKKLVLPYKPQFVT